jgi:hypothetical protein
MFWIRSSIIGVIAFFSYSFFDVSPVAIFNDNSGVITSIEIPKPIKVSPVTTPTVAPTAIPVLTPLSDVRYSVGTAVATPTPLHIIHKLEVLQLAAKTSWRPHLQTDFELLWDIIACESGASGQWVSVHEIGDLDIEDGPSLGLMQINIFYWPSLHKHFDLMDPIDNLQAGWEVWNIQGWEAWSCYEIDE